MNETVDGFEIESDVPIPEKVRNKYPFDHLNIGDSFVVHADPQQIRQYGEQEALKRVRSALSSSAASYMRRNPHVQLIVRKVDEGTIRCWRVHDNPNPAPPQPSSKPGRKPKQASTESEGEQLSFENEQLSFSDVGVAGEELPVGWSE